MWLPLAPPSLPTPATLYQPTPPLLHRRPLSGAHRIFHPDQIIPTNKTRHVRARRTTVCVRLSAARERRRETVEGKEEGRRRGRKRARGRSIAAKKVREGEGKRKKKEEKKKAEREGEVEEKERESEKGGERGERNAIDR